VLGIVYRCIATHLTKKAGFSRQTGQAGAVTLIQRFGSALNLNVHFHMLFLDGVYVERSDGSLRFRWGKAPTSAELTRLAQTLARCGDREDPQPPQQAMNDTLRQFARVERFLTHLKDNRNRVQEEYEDNFWSFFQNCWHLKGWIKTELDPDGWTGIGT
jgi:hypothetical protein